MNENRRRPGCDELTGERHILPPYGRGGYTRVGKTKDIREAVEAELDFDPLVDSANITRGLFIVSGLVSVAFGVVIFSRPSIGAVTIALLFGFFSLMYGFSQITTGTQLRRTGSAAHKVLEDAV
jgi:hypothetical protein